MSDFVKSNPELDAAINEATNFEGMRESMLRTMAAQGQIVRSREDAYDVRVIATPQTPGAALPATGYKFEREVRFHPSTGKRTLLIRANSIEDLNALENQVTR